MLDAVFSKVERGLASATWLMGYLAAAIALLVVLLAVTGVLSPRIALAMGVGAAALAVICGVYCSTRQAAVSSGAPRADGRAASEAAVAGGV